MQAHFHAGSGSAPQQDLSAPMILAALSDYDLGYTLEATAARLKKKTNRSVAAFGSADALSSTNPW